VHSLAVFTPKKKKNNKRVKARAQWHWIYFLKKQKNTTILRVVKYSNAQHLMITRKFRERFFKTQSVEPS
jgi:hypothetical protein